jgi:hypothetical protein
VSDKFIVHEGGGEFKLSEKPKLTILEGGKSMSIEVKRALFVDQNTQTAIQKIYNCGEYLDPGYTQQIGAVIVDLAEAAKKNDLTYMEKYKEYVEKDEKGEPIYEFDDKGNKTGYKVRADFRAQANAIDAELGQSTISVPNRPKLYLSKLAGAKLSPKDLNFLGFLIDETR